MPISIIVHGGAWAIPDDDVEAHEQGVAAALQVGWDVLQAGGAALDACETAVRVLEDNPTFDAGVGSFLNADGRVELDAAIMDGASLHVGAVAAVQRVRNPVSLARYVMTTEHVLVVGSGAERLAQVADLPLCAPDDLIIPRERERWQWVQQHPHLAGGAEFRSHDTVGALALDEHGNLAVAISTGGTLNKVPGRVGDTPLVGCGFYADNERGACCATGQGEAIMRVVLAKSVVDRVAAGEAAPAAAQHELDLLHQRTNGAAGCIVLRPDGSVGVWHNTPRMAYAHRTGDTPAYVGITHGQRHSIEHDSVDLHHQRD